MDITVVTVTYNAASFIGPTLESVAEQECDGVEHVIIDGGSTDETLAIVRSRESRIAYWSSEQDAGIFDAMNRGIAAAQGRWLYFLNAGDRLYGRSTLSAVRTALEKLSHDVLLAYGKVLYRDRYGRLIRVHGRPWGGDWIADLPHHQATFTRRDAFERYGVYDPSYRIIADAEMFYRVESRACGCTSFLPIVVGSFDVGGVSARLTNLNRYEREFHAARRRYDLPVNRFRQLVRFAGTFGVATVAQLLGDRVAARIVDGTLRVLGRQPLYNPNPLTRDIRSAPATDK